MLQAVRLQLHELSGVWLRHFGLTSHRLPQAAWRDLSPPDSPLAQAAAALCADNSPEFLLNHCLRTYAWGVLLAHRDDVRYDNEVLYLSCLLHDLGLTAVSPPDSPTPCFAVAGAAGALRFLNTQGCLDERAVRVANAISLHLNAEVPVTQGSEAHLLRQGAGLDVVGGRYGQVSAPAREQVLALYPRGPMKTGLRGLLGAPSVRRPRTRLALLCSCGFLPLVGATPFKS